jgi:deoxyribose-phosphate aldolase
MNLASMIDHTALTPSTTAKHIEQLCQEAMEHSFASVCVNPIWVSHSRALLQGSSVKVCTVVDFPLGSASTDLRVSGVSNLVESGVDEIDIVAPLGLILSGDWTGVEKDLEKIRAITRYQVLKLIMETCLLDEASKRFLAKMASDLGYEFVKTSTGFSHHGATFVDVQILKESIRPWTEVKASGGIKTLEDALFMVKAGATRIGTSRGIDIISPTNRIRNDQ